jgi:hypothetical protein
LFGKLFGSAQKDEMLKAKQAYEQAVEAQGDSREIRALRIRIALRCRAVLDKTFIHGAEKTAEHAEASMLAIAADEEKPPAPKPSSFQTIKSVNGEILAYVPLPFAEEMFTIGAKYQMEEITAEQAIEFAQGVADKISDELKLDKPIEALNFLREQLSEENGESGSDSEDNNPS